MLAELETALNQHESLNFYVELDGFSRIEIAALKEDLSFDFEHKDRFGKLVVAGEWRLEEWATKMSDLAFDAPMRFFESAESKQAGEWVNSHRDSPFRQRREILS